MENQTSEEFSFIFLKTHVCLAIVAFIIAKILINFFNFSAPYLLGQICTYSAVGVVIFILRNMLIKCNMSKLMPIISFLSTVFIVIFCVGCQQFLYDDTLHGLQSLDRMSAMQIHLAHPTYPNAVNYICNFFIAIELLTGVGIVFDKNHNSEHKFKAIYILSCGVYLVTSLIVALYNLYIGFSS